MNRVTILGGVLLGCSLISGAASAAAPLKQRHQIHDGGRAREFEIATDEVFHRGPARRVEKIPAQPDAEAVRARARELQRVTTNEVELVLYPRGVPRTEFTRRVLTRQVLVRLEPGADADALARAAGLTVRRPVAGLPGGALLESAEPGGALTAAEELRGRRGVISAEPQLARQRQRKLIPNDPLFSQQWHLRNTGQNGGTPGMDINVTNVWNQFRGAGVTIGIVDDGLEMTHPDLTANVLAALGRDFNDEDNDPSPNPLYYDFHGTAAAGVAAARGNNGTGVSGVAYESGLVGLRLISEPTTDAQEHDALAWQNQSIHVKNNSWGVPDGSGAGEAVLDGPGPLTRAALADGTATGRGGRGVIYVFSAGNGWDAYEDANYDGYANSIQVIAVAAADDQGLSASYSEPGACIAVSAPSSSSGRQYITTTDLTGNDGYNYAGATGELTNRDYTRTFGGTSSAAPVVSGVAALMLQANPNLGWRDVKEILMRSARPLATGSYDWITNRSGLRHHHLFGAGLVDAGAAVAMATNWINLGPMTSFSLAQSNLSLAIPDGDTNGVARVFTVTNEGFRVEHVTLTVDIPHPYYGDLEIQLVSPAGIVSRLAEGHAVADRDIGGYRGWVFSSVRHWGEPAQGAWTVRVQDVFTNDVGTLQSLKLEFHGSRPAATLVIAATNSTHQLTVRAPPAGWSYAVETSTNLAHWATLSNVTVNAAGHAAVNDSVTATNRFYRARLLP